MSVMVTSLAPFWSYLCSFHSLEHMLEMIKFSQNCMVLLQNKMKIQDIVLAINNQLILLKRQNKTLIFMVVIIIQLRIQKMKNSCSIKRETHGKEVKMEMASDTPYCNIIVSLSFLLIHDLFQVRIASFLCLQSLLA